MMRRFIDYRLSAREVVQLVAELHTRGYEGLRFFGYVAPSGLSYRVHIANSLAMSENGYSLEGQAIWHGSVGLEGCGQTPALLADAFLAEYAEHPDLLAAKVSDPEYVQWFRQVLTLATRNTYLSPYQEYEESSIYKGYIATVGGQGERLSLPPVSPRPYTGTPAAFVWVDSAAQLAQRLHQGQVDKAGKPYFEGHLTAVAWQGRDWRERVVGYLHDAVEDTDTPLDVLLSRLENLAGGALPSADRWVIEQALSLLDHHASPSREAYIKRIATNPLATAVKLHDLRHNMDLSRIKSPKPRDYERVKRYKREYIYLRDFLRPPKYIDYL